MKKKWLLLLLAFLVTLAALFFATRDTVRSSVSVTFLCYTNRDTRGGNDRYTWAWFRIDNRSRFMFVCQQGVKDIERASVWIQDTNRLGFQYDPEIEPGKSLTVCMMPPADATRWRSSFLLTKVAVHSGNYLTMRHRFEAFLDGLRLGRLGLHAQPWKGKNLDPTVVTSKTVDL